MSADAQPRMLLHWAANGSFHWFATPSVQVICVDERSPDDRVYITEGGALPEMFGRCVAGEDPIDILNDIEGRAA